MLFLFTEKSNIIEGLSTDSASLYIINGLHDEVLSLPNEIQNQDR